MALLLILVTAGAAYYGKTHFAMNADLSDLVKQQGEWRDNLDAVEKEFPESGNVVVVISGEDSAANAKVTEELADAFEKQSLFSEVFAPSTYDWFEKYGLGFLSESEFDELRQSLSLILPDLMVSAQYQSIEPYLGGLDKKLSSNELSAEEATKLLQPLVQALNQQNVDWQDVLFSNVEKPKGYVVNLNARPDFNATEPNKLIMQTVHDTIEQADVASGVQVRVTGQTALDYDEIQDANESVALAGTVSLVSLIAILAIGIRSLRIILASYLAVIVGLVWTFAAGLLLVGAFNTISIVFMVIFIGLGVDFAVHLSLHIYEQRLKGYDNDESLKLSILHCMSPLGLCALSSAIGFLSFYPTAYTGLGELGIISAAGMVLGLLATFLIIPIFFQFFGYPKVKVANAKRSKLALDLSEFIARRHSRIIVLTLFGAVVTGVVASKFQFDFSTLVLKNKRSESVETLQWLQDNKLGSSYQLFAVADDEKQALDWQAKLETMPEVTNTVSAMSFMPTDFDARVAELRQSATPDPSQISTLSLDAFLDKYGSHLSLLGWNGERDIPQSQLLGYLTAELPDLSGQSEVVAPTVDDLPDSIFDNYISTNGKWLVSVTPSGDMRDVSELNAFISAVQSVVPDATGRAVAEQQVGKIIVKAFYTAIAISLAGITVILLFSVRYKLDIIFIFIPLLLTTTTTLAIAHWFGQSLNMANIIVVPLIFGLGVDNGIHIVKRFRHEQTITRFFSSSTPKATLISCLTTIATFGALTLAEHQGMHSIGSC
ncbi:hopanoid-associated RND transporter [Vibrio sp. JCM 19236]|nr:hopanoid-associated RND transporter [Vibrio sp. JCM 19236]